jgi:hypothetical protein
MASASLTAYSGGMQNQAKIVERWRYLRGLLTLQLEAFASGGLRVHSNEINVSAAAIAKLEHSIAEFDALIAEAAASKP